MAGSEEDGDEGRIFQSLLKDWCVLAKRKEGSTISRSFSTQYAHFRTYFGARIKPSSHYRHADYF